MSSPTPHSDPNPEARSRPRPRARDWRPSAKVLLVVALAFAAGLLLFVALWLDQRDSNTFYRADGATPSAEGRPFEPLPAPLPAVDRDDTASGLDDVEQQAAEQAARTPAEIEPAPPVPAAPPAAPQAPAAIADSDVPQPIESPAPRYPREAQRRGESGTVLLRVHVDAAGRPYAVDLVQSSHSRALDRAAADAVRRWRFRPAMRDGQPVPGIVQIPVTFNLGR